MDCVKAIIGNEGAKKLVENCFYFCKYFRCSRYKLQRTKAMQSHPYQGSGGNFEMLMLKHDRAYSACEFRIKYVCDNEMCGNTVLPGIAY